MKLNAGIAFDTESSTGIKLALDVVDILSIPDALDAGYSTKGVILGHTKIGAEFSLFNFLKVRGGLNSGYFTLVFQSDLISVGITDKSLYKDCCRETGSFYG